MDCVTFGDGCRNPPHGTLGGTPGTGGGQYVEDPGSDRRVFVSSSGNIRVEPGQRWVGVSTGGGGYGNPHERDVEQVRRDVRDGLITRERARDQFGVAVSDAFDPVIDATETEHLRAELETVDRPIVDPTAPGASTWLDKAMRDIDEYRLNPL